MTDISFTDLGLSPAVLQAVKQAGYETPSPIQAKAIPILLRGENLLGTAQTGTGKTAAFALPLLSRLHFSSAAPALLILTPTRELAIQVAETITRYAAHLPKVSVVPVYGGQDIGIQLRALKRKATVIVATPGRLIDHLERNSIDLSEIQAIVLDEADEMLDMGFMEDVEKILSSIPETAQRALFSATMPVSVKKIIERYLGRYSEACIESKTSTVEKVRQRYLTVRSEHKLEALTRVLEGEEFDGMLIFVRTKQATAELSEKLEARGFNTAPLSGDLAQALRERTINRLKDGKIDIVIATDVAARGLDVNRITHVVNYDIPYDTESYVHRIGRTGRAGRDGNAILFITPRERKLLKMIEKATRQSIEQMEMPSGEQISERRILAFEKNIADTIENNPLEEFRSVVENLSEKLSLPVLEIAAAVTYLAQKGQPLFPEMETIETLTESKSSKSKNEKASFDGDFKEKKRIRKERKDGLDGVEEGFERYYLAVGRKHHVSPRDIVGAIAGEADIPSAEIGRIKLFDAFSTVELPEGMPKDIFKTLKKMFIRNNPSGFRLMTDEPPPASSRREKPFRAKSTHEKPFKERSGNKPPRRTRRFGRH
jgi:ATP-dependent RNA helicase DeaD